ncbi:iron-siderophore ABC transporter substrate-binding protein [Herbidospora galbida]|uniref:Iron-siderophore ABC transporter substrate-binding protein n=1 Tax=Herbidospora galbida TaxID=2575442 RepID=A0A4U3M837_9ACTN|nr:iron-siderophore ABC transporter substrate-binding protein [Herbidospora galbida]TKK85135.1 iron-siderophore ABC transporter substrate-binding protein [Herbidospora galbida]
MKPLRTALLIAAVLGLGACGTTEPAAAPSAAPAASETQAQAITITDGLGREVKLAKPATRVVGLEWGEIEMLVGLGVMPVGAADVKGYATWVTAAPLDPSVKDVGTRGEPSVDAIVALQPDLIVMEAAANSPIVAQLEKFVPVLVPKGSSATDNLGRMRADLKMIATAVGKEAEADRLLTDMDAKFATAKSAIEAAGHAGSPFAMADGWSEGGSVSIRMFGKGALVAETAEAIGLRNAWTGDVDPDWGLGTTDVEGLSPLKDEKIRFFYNASDGADVFADDLKNNAIWTSLPFVKSGQVTKLPDGIWTFGGPLSVAQYADALVKAYTA